MRAFALDPETGDLLFVGGRLALVEGVEAVAQRLRGRLSLWAGEWFGDTAIGVPYRSFLGVKGAQSVAESALRRAILTCPGVAALERVAFTFDAATRSGTVTFRARTADGTVLPGFEDGGFRVGA